MSFYLTVIVILYCAAMSLAIYEDYTDRRWYIITKPVPMGINIGLVTYALAAGTEKSVLIYLVLAGLIAGVIGDILLSLGKRFFLHGLVSFLLGHGLYVSGFFTSGIVLHPLTVTVAAAIAAFLGILLIKNMTNKKYRIPLVMYLVVITLMVISAVSYDIIHSRELPLFALGAVLFALSDASLAWNTFIKEFRASGVIILFTYYTAQFLFALKILSQSGLI